MLTDYQRVQRYLAQTGRRSLTPGQRRRCQHKLGHQMEEAAARRDGVAKIRASIRQRRKNRLAGLLAR